MGNKVKAVVKGGEVFMDAEQWEEVVAGLLRIIEVQGKSIDAMARAVEVMAGIEGPVEGGMEEAEGGGEGKAEGE